MSVDFKGDGAIRMRIGLLAISALLLACAGAGTPPPDGSSGVERTKYGTLVRALVDTIDWRDVCPADLGCGEIRVVPTVYRAAPEGLKLDPTRGSFNLLEADMPARSSSLPLKLSDSRYRDGASFATATFAVWMEPNRPATLPNAEAVIFSPRYTRGLTVLAFARVEGTTWRIERLVSTPY